MVEGRVFEVAQVPVRDPGAKVGGGQEDELNGVGTRRDMGNQMAARTITLANITDNKTG